MDEGGAIRLCRIIGEIFLMIIFRRIKFVECGNFRDNRFVVNLRRVEFFNNFFRRLFLFVRVIKDRRTIRTADIISLPVQSRRVVNCKKHPQKIGE